MVWKVEWFKYEKLGTKGEPIGYFEFSRAFGENHARAHRRRPPHLRRWCTSASHVLFEPGHTQFLLDRVCGCGLTGCRQYAWPAWMQATFPTRFWNSYNMCVKRFWQRTIMKRLRKIVPAAKRFCKPLKIEPFQLLYKALNSLQKNTEQNWKFSLLFSPLWISSRSWDKYFLF